MNNRIKKTKEKSVFEKHLQSSLNKKIDKESSEEKRKDNRYKKLQTIFEEIGNRQNRYLFYCPDIPFANSMVKIIYEYVTILNENGYNAIVLHEVKGFVPEWMDREFVKKIKREYLSEKQKDKYSSPEWDFKPTDTIIIPDGFWETMKGLYEIKTPHKVVLCLGYSGLSTIDAGLNWNMVGVTDVICVSEKIRQDYEKIWPNMNYHVVGYQIDIEKFTPIEKIEQKPVIGLMARSREDAQQIINIFFGKYPFLDIFQFKILKKLSIQQYIDDLKKCSVLVFIDEKAGYPAPPLEALAADVPVIGYYGRGMSHIMNHPSMYWTSVNDNFTLVDDLAAFCLNWLETIPLKIEDKEILKEFSKESVEVRLLEAIEKLQDHKIKLFTAIKQAVDEGKLEEEKLN